MKKKPTSKKPAVAQARAGEPARQRVAAVPGQGNDPRAALAIWGVPLDFPCRLIVLPARMRSYCADHGLMTIGQLLSEWDRLGRARFREQPALGAKSVSLLQRFVDSLRAKDFQAASAFLPLDAPNGGLSLWRALWHVAAVLSDSKRKILSLSLVDGTSMTTITEALGLSRQAGSLVESEYLDEVRAVLAHFAADRDRLFAAWLADDDWFQTPDTPKLGDGDREFLAATLAAVFQDTPQGAARASKKEADKKACHAACHAELATHPHLWFGGVDLAKFLTDRLPVAEHQEFFERVVRTPALCFRFADGRVRPARTGLRLTVEAMLSRTQGSVSLSQLIELVNQTGNTKPALTRMCRPAATDAWPKPGTAHRGSQSNGYCGTGDLWRPPWESSAEGRALYCGMSRRFAEGGKGQCQDGGGGFGDGNG